MATRARLPGVGFSVGTPASEQRWACCRQVESSVTHGLAPAKCDASTDSSETRDARDASSRAERRSGAHPTRNERL